MTDPEELDPFIEAEIDRALAPYRDLLPPQALDDFRDEMRLALTSHPVATRLVRQLRPPPMVASSGEVDASGRPVEAPIPLTRARTGGKR